MIYHNIDDIVVDSYNYVEGMTIVFVDTKRRFTKKICVEYNNRKYKIYDLYRVRRNSKDLLTLVLNKVEDSYV